jgi:hypothetical protein
MPAETGYAALLWRRGYQALAKAGYRAPTVWAHGPGRREIARGEPEGGALKFTFRRGDPTWGQLVATPDLSALLVVDRRSKQILGVTFRGRDTRAV